MTAGIGRLATESPDYKELRDKLHQAELALRDQREEVAKLRRRLPLDTAIEDYALMRGPDDLNAGDKAEACRLSDLFIEPDKPLIVYQFMFGGAQEKPCPMCTMWTDGLNAVAPHVQKRANMAAIAAAEIADFREFARQRAWHNLTLASCAPSSLKRDLGFETEDGSQLPGVSVFVRAEDGLRHFYSVSAVMGEGEFRGIDLLTPVWNLFDLTPDGRGD